MPPIFIPKPEWKADLEEQAKRRLQAAMEGARQAGAQALTGAQDTVTEAEKAAQQAREAVARQAFETAMAPLRQSREQLDAMLAGAQDVGQSLQEGAGQSLDAQRSMDETTAQTTERERGQTYASPGQTLAPSFAPTPTPPAPTPESEAPVPPTPEPPSLPEPPPPPISEPPFVPPKPAPERTGPNPFFTAPETGTLEGERITSELAKTAMEQTPGGTVATAAARSAGSTGPMTADTPLENVAGMAGLALQNVGAPLPTRGLPGPLGRLVGPGSAIPGGQVAQIGARAVTEAIPGGADVPDWAKDRGITKDTFVLGGALTPDEAIPAAVGAVTDPDSITGMGNKALNFRVPGAKAVSSRLDDAGRAAMGDGALGIRAGATPEPGRRITAEGAQELRDTYTSNAPEPEPIDVFYSKLAREANKLPTRAPIGQIRNQLTKAGVKPDEMRWTGLEQYLADVEAESGPGAMITRADVQARLQADRVDLREVVNEFPPEALAAKQRHADLWQQFRDLQREDAGAAREYDRLRSAGDEVGAARVSGRSRENYRARQELRDQMNEARREMERLTPRGTEPQYENYTQDVASGGGDGPRPGYREILLTTRNPIEGGGGDYISPHWQAKNIPVHARVTDRTLPDGRKVLHVEEMQSDWHQAGRDQGYRYPPSAVRAEVGEARAMYERLRPAREAQAEHWMRTAEERRVLNRAIQYDVDGPDDALSANAAVNRLRELDDELDQLVAARQDAQAEANAWARGNPARHEALAEVQLAARRARERELYDAHAAAQERFDAAFEQGGIDVVSPEADALAEELSRLGEMYREARGQLDDARVEMEDLRNKRDQRPPAGPWSKSWPELGMKRLLRMAAEEGYDAVSWTPGKVQQDRYGRSVEQAVRRLEFIPERQTLRAVDHEGQVRELTGVTPDNLHTYVGQDISQRLKATEPVSEVLPMEEGGVRTFPSHNLEGDDLRFNAGGSSGMNVHYDQVMPQAANKLAKPWGARVYQGEIELSPGGERSSAHILEVTPEMRQGVQQQGFPLFARQGGLPLGGAEAAERGLSAATGAIAGGVRADQYDEDDTGLERAARIGSGALGGAIIGANARPATFARALLRGADGEDLGRLGAAAGRSGRGLEYDGPPPTRESRDFGGARPSLRVLRQSENGRLTGLEAQQAIEAAQRQLREGGNPDDRDVTMSYIEFVRDLIDGPEEEAVQRGLERIRRLNDPEAYQAAIAKIRATEPVPRPSAEGLGPGQGEGEGPGTGAEAGVPPSPRAPRDTGAGTAPPDAAPPDAAPPGTGAGSSGVDDATGSGPPRKPPEPDVADPETGVPPATRREPDPQDGVEPDGTLPPEQEKTRARQAEEQRRRRKVAEASLPKPGELGVPPPPSFWQGLEAWRYSMGFLANPATAAADFAAGAAEIPWTKARNFAMDLSDPDAKWTRSAEQKGANEGYKQGWANQQTIFKTGKDLDELLPGAAPSEVHPSLMRRYAERGEMTRSRIFGGIEVASRGRNSLDAVAHGTIYGRLLHREAALAANKAAKGSRQQADIQPGQPGWWANVQAFVNKAADKDLDAKHPVYAAREKALDLANKAIGRNDPGAIGNALGVLFQNVAFRPFFPLFKTGYNISKTGIERSPLGLATMLYDKIAEPVAKAGGEKNWRRPITRERKYDTGMGSAVWVGALLPAVMAGYITGYGPEDEKTREDIQAQGWRPYSILIPGAGYVSYRRAGALAAPLALAGAIGDAHTFRDADEPIGSEVADATENFARWFGDQFVLRTVGDLQRMSQNLGMGFPEWVGRYVTSYTGGMPLTVLASAIDPWQRDIDVPGDPLQTGVNQLRMMLPGDKEGRQSLPIKYDVFGEPLDNPQYGPRVLSPYPVGPLKGELPERTKHLRQFTGNESAADDYRTRQAIQATKAAAQTGREVGPETQAVMDDLEGGEYDYAEARALAKAFEKQRERRRTGVEGAEDEEPILPLAGSR